MNIKFFFNVSLLVGVGLIGLLLAGCGMTSSARYAANDIGTPLSDQEAYVIIDGRVRGTTPATLRVRRSYAEFLVQLKQGERTLRTYEVEQLYTSNAAQLTYSYSASNFAGLQTYTVQDLPVSNDTLYVIPNMGQPIRIEDHEFGLTLIVED